MIVTYYNHSFYTLYPTNKVQKWYMTCFYSESLALENLTKNYVDAKLFVFFNCCSKDFDFFIWTTKICLWVPLNMLKRKMMSSWIFNSWFSHECLYHCVYLLAPCSQIVYFIVKIVSFSSHLKMLPFTVSKVVTNVLWNGHITRNTPPF